MGLVTDDVEESKADFPFGSSSSAAMLSCLLPTRRQKGGFTSTFTKILHSRKIYSKVTAAVFLRFRHRRSAKHFSFSRVPRPSPTWPNVSGCTQTPRSLQTVAQGWAATLLGLAGHAWQNILSSRNFRGNCKRQIVIN